MASNFQLPIVGKLESVAIDDLRFKADKLPIKAGPTNVEFSIAIAFDDDDPRQYGLRVQVKVECTDQDSGERAYLAQCQVTGFYVSEESLAKYKGSMPEHARARAILQLYPTARLQLINLLAHNGLNLPSGSLPIEPDLRSDSQPPQKAKKRRKRKAIKKAKRSKVTT